MRVFDAGCGTGRNLMYMLRSGFDVAGADADPVAVASVQALAARLAPHLPPSNFRAERLDRLTFDAASADVVISSAVLHFAGSDEEFDAMLHGTWRLLRPGGLLFCRLASTIGMEHRMQSVAGRRFRLPDGSVRYLVDEALLARLTAALGGDLVDPIKTTVVQDQRCMTTWVVRRQRA
jgi:2-polyprenyl-3-methyl-5-hydroxy-6-metoxy-1,4-benzoquinol methylase